MLECHEVPRLPHKTTLQPALIHSTRKGFAASPIDTATAPQKPAIRNETCWSIKTSISCENSSNFTLPSVKKQTFSYEFSYGLTANRRFCARLPSIFISCHKMPRLPRNLHLVTTSRSADNAIPKNTQHETSKVLRLPRKMQRIVWKCGKSIAPATQNYDF